MLKTAIDAMKLEVDLTEKVVIADSYLKKDIKKNLGHKINNIRIDDISKGNNYGICWIC